MNDKTYVAMTDSTSNDPPSEPLSDRVRTLIGDRSIRYFAQSAKIKNSTLHSILGGTKPTVDNLVAIARAGGVTVDWLATGEDPMRPKPREDSDSLEAATGRALILRSTVPGGIVRIPLLDTTALSSGTNASEAIVPPKGQVDFIYFYEAWLPQNYRVNSDDLFALPFAGESMVPTLTPRDLLLVDGGEAAKKPRDGIYVVRLDGQLLVKRLQRFPGRKIKISSDNTAYETYMIEVDRGMDFVILGRVLLALGIRHF